MKIVALSDPHGQYRKVIVPDGDILIIAGDFLKYGSRKEIPDFCEWIHTFKHTWKIVIAGNHDWAFQKTPTEARYMLAGPSKLVYLEDREVVIDGVKFYGSPWQPDFYNWAFNLPRGPLLQQKWDKIPLDTDVLITHGPPGEILDTNLRDMRFGCQDLRQRVLDISPKLHIFGHAHACYGYCHYQETHFYNVSVCNESYQVVNPPMEIDYANLR